MAHTHLGNKRFPARASLGALLATAAVLSCKPLTAPEDCDNCKPTKEAYHLAIPVEKITEESYTPCIPGIDVTDPSGGNDFTISFIDHTGKGTQLEVRNADWCGAVHAGAAAPVSNHVGYSWTGQLSTPQYPDGAVHGELTHLLELWPSNDGSVVLNRPNTMPGWDLIFLPSGVFPASRETIVGRAAACQYELILRDNITGKQYSSCESGSHHIPATAAHTTTPFTNWRVLDTPRQERFGTQNELSARIRELYGGM